MDYVALTYVLLLGYLVIPFHNNVANWAQYPVIHSVLAVLIFELLNFGEFC